MMIKKMRGSQRNSLTMWKRQILVERRSPATEGFAFIDAHQRHSPLAAVTVDCRKPAQRRTGTLGRHSMIPSGFIGCHFYSLAGAKNLLTIKCLLTISGQEKGPCIHALPP